MVHSVILSCTLECTYVLGILNNADNALVPVVIATYRAYLPLGEILTALAAMHVLLGVDKSLREILDLVLVH